MTDDTRDHDRPFADRTPGETAEPTESATRTADRSTENRPSRRDGAKAGARAERSETDRTPFTDESRQTVTDPGGGPNPGQNAEQSAEPSADPNADRLEERLRAVERALTGTDDAVADLGDEASASAEREELSTRLDDLEARVEELEASTQAIRGYVGSVRSVNQAVERRADLALAKASENGGAATDDEPIARESTAANENAIDDDALHAGAPSEADLDAAVPTDRRRGNGTRSAAEQAADRAETDDEKADDSWRAGALDRLRDSL